MAPNLFKILPKSFLGIDVGTSAIKLVELEKIGGRLKLANYGELKPDVLYKKQFRTFEKNVLLLSTQDIARGIMAIMEEAKIKTRQAVFSIPDFSTFYTNFDLPPMTKEEIPNAVAFAARQYIPLSLSEVTLDWSIIRQESVGGRETRLKILLVAVPNEIVSQYEEIARLAKLAPPTLEAEVYGLARSLVKKDKKAVILIDIGAQSTTVSVVDNGVLKTSHSFDVSGNEFTGVLAKGLSISYEEADEMKRKYGLSSSEETGGKNVVMALAPLIDTILTETRKVIHGFYQTEGKDVSKIILAGGAALLPKLKEYFSTELKKEVEIANPFAEIFYPPILGETLREMGPSYSVVVGMALRGLE